MNLSIQVGILSFTNNKCIQYILKQFNHPFVDGDRKIYMTILFISLKYTNISNKDIIIPFLVKLI